MILKRITLTLEYNEVGRIQARGEISSTGCQQLPPVRFLIDDMFSWSDWNKDHKELHEISRYIREIDIALQYTNYFGMRI